MSYVDVYTTLEYVLPYLSMTFLRAAVIIILFSHMTRMDDVTSPVAMDTAKEPEITNLSNVLGADYDKQFRPNFHGAAVVVTTSVHINSFHATAGTEMDYTVTLFLRTRWNDPRLRYHDAANHILTFHSDGVREVWIPPLFFPDEKSGHFHKLTTENILLRIYPDGTVLHSARFTITLTCMMRLERYPMDEQECNIEIESFAYTTDDVILQWAAEDDDLEAFAVPQGISLPQFEFVDATIVRQLITRNYTTGSFSHLTAIFRLQRQKEMFIMSNYLPSLLIVVLSWFSFWINPNSEPARVSLVMTALLTLCTQMNGIHGTMPQIAHLKAIDVWMSACLVFVFAALVEYAAVNYISLRIKRQSRRKQTSPEMVSSLKDKQSTVANTGNRDEQKQLHPAESSLRGSDNSATELSYGSERSCLSVCELSPEQIDYYSRIIFPATFMVFNVFYWPTYLHWVQ
ncbi:glycine receptor subunit alphaZ1-like [Saccoglossus kowalevskii]